MSLSEIELDRAITNLLTQDSLADTTDIGPVTVVSVDCTRMFT